MYSSASHRTLGSISSTPMPNPLPGCSKIDLRGNPQLPEIKRSQSQSPPMMYVLGLERETRSYLQWSQAIRKCIVLAF